ncbi:hypothetical protein CIB84_001034 [Bambusicola thoracicus]|uniref:Uncharacterized protein n=1 Tax=Bambusicola thoracicus TaxID=9083 RepID=A0A2P4TFS3_BAMTH|nr:hypothetical protein CIB84_001034 [Bambusicola thoracicus]
MIRPTATPWKSHSTATLSVELLLLSLTQKKHVSF